MRTLFLSLALIATFAIAAVFELRAHPTLPQSGQGEQKAAPTQSANEPTAKKKPVADTWTLYQNPDYHYSLSYTGTLGFDYSTPAVDVLYIVIDQHADPIHVCAASNPAEWTARQLFEAWKQNPSTKKGSSEFPCADYPSYARVSGSDIAADVGTAYEVISFRGPYETVCSYFASPKTLLAVCLPGEDSSKSSAWPDHLRIYKQIVRSVDMPK